MLSRFHGIPERKGQTDRPTNRRKDRIAISISRVSMLSRVSVLTRDKNCKDYSLYKFKKLGLRTCRWELEVYRSEVVAGLDDHKYWATLYIGIDRRTLWTWSIASLAIFVHQRVVSSGAVEPQMRNITVVINGQLESIMYCNRTLANLQIIWDHEWTDCLLPSDSMHAYAIMRQLGSVSHIRVLYRNG